MIQLQLLELAKKQFPDLNFDVERDIIKAEKILKAEAKLSPNVNSNDVENLISFLRSNGEKFTPFLNNKVVATILKGKGDYINAIQFDAAMGSKELIDELQHVFSVNVQAYLTQCITRASWHSLKTVFLHYSFLINDQVREEVYETLHSKNQAIISAIHHDRYLKFEAANSYVAEIAYYSTLSSVHSYLFDEDIQRINNSIVGKQKNSSTSHLYCLGKILYAVTFFDAFADNLKETLATNQEVAHSWMYPTAFQQGKQITWKHIMFIVITTIICTAVIILMPDSSGAGIGITIFLCRMIWALKKK